jgi:hypothetical protein
MAKTIVSSRFFPPCANDMSIARRKLQVCAAVPGCQVSRRAETLDRAEAAFVGHPNGGLVLLEPKDAWEMGEKHVFFHGKNHPTMADFPALEAIFSDLILHTRV